jgi:septum formation inhibitor-activating ATPase MinD
MNEFQLGATDIRKIGKWLGGLIALADKLEQVGTIEQATEEAKSRLSAAKGDEAVYAAAMGERKRRSLVEIDTAKTAVELEVAGRRAEGERLIAAARVQAAAITDAASASAAKASAETAAALAGKHAEIATAKAAHEDLLGKIKTATDALTELRQSHADVAEQHRSVTAALAALKAKL